MPKMDGFELYTKMREKDPKVKICFLTASEALFMLHTSFLQCTLLLQNL